jgi:predicted nucleotidyltransferase component of viral defense system
MRRVSLERYLADKVQCLAERVEARDLVDVLAVIRHAPSLRARLRRLVLAQDAALLAERLLGWTERSIRKDLAAYRDVNPDDAFAARDLIMGFVGKQHSSLVKRKRRI